MPDPVETLSGPEDGPLMWAHRPTDPDGALGHIRPTPAPGDLTLVRTPNGWTCLCCSFATIFGIDYGRMVAELGHDGSAIVRPSLPDPARRRGHHIQEILDVAERLGYLLTPFEARPQSESERIPYEIDFPQGNAYRFNRFLEGQIGVLVGLNLRSQPHAVVWNRGEILDPASGRTYGPHLFQPQTFWRVLKKP